MKTNQMFPPNCNYRVAKSNKEYCKICMYSSHVNNRKNPNMMCTNIGTNRLMLYYCNPFCVCDNFEQRRKDLSYK